MPVVIFSAGTARTPDERRQWTSRHVSLAASLPRAEHIVLADRDHAMNQDSAAEIADAVGRVLDAAGPA